MSLDKDSRKYDILFKSVDKYVKDALPITSGTLQKDFASVSTATLRNELNSLEAMGYLRQLHTSGGRVPTSSGYKLYVDEILSSQKINGKIIKSVQDDYDKKSINLLNTLSSFAKGLSKLTNCPAVLMQQGLDNLSIINLQIIPLIQKNALLLIETDCGVIDDSIDLSSDIDRQSCIEASTFLTEHFKGRTIRFMIDNINNVALSTSSQVLAFKSLLDTVANCLIAVTKQGVNISQEGLPKLIEGLTAEETTNIKNIVNLLDDENKMVRLINNNTNDDISCNVASDDDLQGNMIMTAPIIINGVNVASLSLVAPQRVDYASLASSLKYITTKAKELEQKE